MWIKVSDYSPPEQEVVWTKIDDTKGGERNLQKLKRVKNLWWFEDGSAYVYYTPTHWKILKEIIMKITVIKLQGKGTAKADYVSLHHFTNVASANEFIKAVTSSGKYWTVASVAHEGVEYETDKDSHA